MTIAVIDDKQLAPTTPLRWRGDIEGLRAVAVLAVLAYHAELGPFHGGYVGVDVFFVVSGFLITSLLVRDLSARGAASLPNFWARRARRLLPAAFLVVGPIVFLAATLVRRVTLRVMLAVVCLLLVMSFVLCIHVGAHHQQTAF